MQAHGYTQIVGNPCATCARRVVSLDDGGACGACGAVVHVDDACWQAHWDAEHVGAADYRGVTRAPAPRAARSTGPADELRRFPGGAEGLLCIACRRRVTARITTTGLGFEQFTCPACAVTVQHPLPGGRQTAYLAVILLSVATAVYCLSQGQVPWPGLFALPPVIALLRNRGLERQLARAEMSALACDDVPVRKKKPKKRRHELAAG